jgi:D-tyrosyl-tRNA(Tyr) deacylase
MKAVIQRVSSASVKIDNQIISQIKNGLLVLLGIANSDTEKDAALMVDKIQNLRIFEDEANKMNLSVKDINGEILVVSQFTLLADVEKGRRPSFTEAASPQKAEEIYNKVINSLEENQLKVEAGKFKEHMQVELVNDGPVTIIFDTNKK